MSRRMPKKWEMPQEFSKPDPSIVFGFRITGRQGWKYLDKDLIMQFFDEVDDTLIYNSEYGSKTHEVVIYNNGLYWIVVHPSAIKTIESLDLQVRLRPDDMTRDIVKVPLDLVNVPEYWNP